MSSSDFFKIMPKAELHAHLSGSINYKTVNELVELHRKRFPNEQLPAECDKFHDLTAANETFDSTYSIFKVAQAIIDTPEAVGLAVKRVIEDFSDENVRFLELRSTPRNIPGKMSKEEYIETVVEAIKEAEARLQIIVKYLVSIDRRGSITEAEEAVKLCLTMHQKFPKVVVGIDLSGDARVNDIGGQILQLLKSVSEAGLKVTVHLAEIPNHDEVMAYLKCEGWRPDRLGHATCIHPEFGGDEALWNTFKALTPPIPVEICLTSNMIVRSKVDCHRHHVQELYKADLPFFICTDDRGVFACSLSGEFEKVARLLDANHEETFKISMAAIDVAFASDEEKIELKAIWNEFWKSNCSAMQSVSHD